MAEKSRKSRTGIQRKGNYFIASFTSAHFLETAGERKGKPKRMRITLQADSFAEAQRERSDLIKEDHKGHLASKELTIAKICQRLEEHYEMRDYASLDLIKMFNQRSIDFFIARGITDPNKVKFSDLSELLGSIVKTAKAPRKDGSATGFLSPSYANRTLQTLKRAFLLAAEDGGLRVPKFPKPLRENKREGYINFEESRRLLAEMPNSNLRIAFLLSYTYAFRKTNVSRLAWSTYGSDQELIDRGAHGKIDLKEGTITLWKTKNGQPLVIPALTSDVREALTEHFEEVVKICRGERSKVVSLRRPLWLMTKSDGERYVFSDLKSWRNACKRAGLEGRVFHDTRRSAVTNLVNSGVTEQDAMKISGHLTDQVFRTYNIRTRENEIEAIRKLEAAQKR
ncbi:integrase [uncultured Mediterranean phage uvDeep-CGR2-AD3-C191]|nr:integrase [uncultured Mediterranean phage uvDeep-CGR2-AD3-C191]